MLFYIILGTKKPEVEPPGKNINKMIFSKHFYYYNNPVVSKIQQKHEQYRSFKKTTSKNYYIYKHHEDYG